MGGVPSVLQVVLKLNDKKFNPPALGGNKTSQEMRKYSLPFMG